MNLAKAEVKILTLQSLAKELDDQRQAAVNSYQQAVGGKAALEDALNKFQEIAKAADEARDTGKLDEYGDPMLVATAIKRYLGKAGGSLENLILCQTLAISEQKGRVEGVDRSITVTKKQYEAERGKVQLYQQMLESGQVEVGGEPPENVVPLRPDAPAVPLGAPGGVPGGRPGAAEDIAQRRAEAKAAKAEKAKAPVKKAPVKKGSRKSAADS